ncbi:MAG: GNAT family N-acetyltransferase [Desulfitobacteriia bacterium]|jgi:lipid II:glycine glycyltransferase (peptidoglycan interpeptide bridge formation enzyme)
MLWGGASYRQYQHYRPNEALQWEAIKYWKERGLKFYEMGGGGLYKKKYGRETYHGVRVMVSKYPFLLYARNYAQKIITKSKLRGIYFRLKNRDSSLDSP